MRVTRLIREYVESTVNAAYRPKINAVSAEYDERKYALQEQLDELIRQSNETALKMIADAGFEVVNCYMNYVRAGGSVYIKEIEAANREKRKALETEAREKINNILLNLELGATRAELDEMLKNLA